MVQAVAQRAPVERTAVAAALREIALLLQLTGGNPYKARAYERGADAVEAVDDLGARVADGTLTEVEGIGDAIAGQITELAQRGTSRTLEKLRGEVPPGTIELALVPGMTIKRIRALHEALGVSDVASLKAACEAHRVREVRGFGAKTEGAIAAGIAQLEAGGGDPRVLLVDAMEASRPILEHLRASAAVAHAEIAGSVRRWSEAVGDLDVVAAAKDRAAAIEAFARTPGAARVERRARDGATIRLGGGLRVDLQVATPRRFANALVRATGSRAHVAKLEALAEARGLSLDRIEARSEEDVYRALGLPFIPPQLREDSGEIERALEGDAFEDLVTLDDIQGLVHCHTVYSDGKGTIEEMAREAEAMGMKYLTITDHSPTAHYAGGVEIDRLKRQWDEIERVQEQVKVKLLRGTESDILADGSLDYPDRVLERLDVVIASIHGRMKMDEDEMTRRVVRAMRHPVFKIWGHALGRLVLRRAPISVRMEEILDAIAESRAAVEVNGDPYRLDMPPEWLREARARGIRFVISVDAHSPRALHNVPFGVAMARRGGVRRREVLNTLSPAAFARAVRPAA